ncbi:MAG: hypothetical protein HYV28_09175 [Ignavibacteriales bacterium]|nr:hypothetical protein [Ignavibacteriales bacterium]
MIHASIHSIYSDNSAVVETNKAYAALHQYGANISVGAHSRLFA